MALRWYIVHAYSNFEHKVKSSLEERIERMGLQDKFGEILVPTEEVVEMKSGWPMRAPQIPLHTRPDRRALQNVPAA